MATEADGVVRCLCKYTLGTRCGDGGSASSFGSSYDCGCGCGSNCDDGLGCDWGLGCDCIDRKHKWGPLGEGWDCGCGWDCDYDYDYDCGLCPLRSEQAVVR